MTVSPSKPNHHRFRFVQISVQIFLSLCRLVMALVMVLTTVTAYGAGTVVFDDGKTRQAGEAVVVVVVVMMMILMMAMMMTTLPPKVRRARLLFAPSNLHLFLPIAIYANTFHHAIPSRPYDHDDDDDDDDDDHDDPSPQVRRARLCSRLPICTCFCRSPSTPTSSTTPSPRWLSPSRTRPASGDSSPPREDALPGPRSYAAPSHQPLYAAPSHLGII
jgi:hypothetical protein